jgi:DNA-binding Lrp family transcriptional regulator
MILKVRLPDTGALLALIERLRKIPGVEQTETTIVLQTMLERPIHLKTAASAKKEG